MKQGCFTLVLVSIALWCWAAEATTTKKNSSTDSVSVSDMAMARQFFEKGRSRGRDKKFDEALEYFRRAEKIMPNDEELLFFIGINTS